MKMKKCPLCGNMIREMDFLGPHCSGCDRVVGDLYTDMAAEIDTRGNVV